MNVATSTLLLLLSVCNLLYISLHIRYNGIQSAVTYSFLGHDYPPMLPLSRPVSSVLLTVEETVHYPLLGYQSDAEWFALAGSSFGYGYIRLNPHDKSCTQASILSNMNIRPCDRAENRMFVVTMFHELHCLRMLNLAFDPIKVIEADHVKHCLNYLRQMILCDADLTVEPAGWEEKITDGAEGRQGSTHVCRNWKDVYDAVEDNWKQWVKFNKGKHGS